MSLRGGEADAAILWCCDGGHKSDGIAALAMTKILRGERAHDPEIRAKKIKAPRRGSIPEQARQRSGEQRALLFTDGVRGHPVHGVAQGPQQYAKPKRTT